VVLQELSLASLEEVLQDLRNKQSHKLLAALLMELQVELELLDHYLELHLLQVVEAPLLVD